MFTIGPGVTQNMIAAAVYVHNVAVHTAATHAVLADATFANAVTAHSSVENVASTKCGKHKLCRVVTCCMTCRAC